MNVLGMSATWIRLEASYWDGGRLARNETYALRQQLIEIFALRAHCGRDARGPSRLSRLDSLVNEQFIRYWL